MSADYETRKYKGYTIKVCFMDGYYDREYEIYNEHNERVKTIDGLPNSKGKVILRLQDAKYEITLDKERRYKDEKISFWHREENGCPYVTRSVNPNSLPTECAMTGIPISVEDVYDCCHLALAKDQKKGLIVLRNAIEHSGSDTISKINHWTRVRNFIVTKEIEQRLGRKAI